MTWSDNTRRERLWRKGLTDTEIAAVVEVSRQAITSWRKKKGFGVNRGIKYVADSNSIFKDDDFLQNFFKGEVQLYNMEKCPRCNSVTFDKDERECWRCGFKGGKI